ncbi:MAG: metallophosphatase family protein [Planctomycetales bacterium]
MRYGVFGDVHSNLEALQSVVDAMQAEGVGRFLCLGDLVGYGADPSACVDLVRELEAVTVLGNHDAAVVGIIDSFEFNVFARAAVDWSRHSLSPDQAQYLKDLNYVEVLSDDLLIFHATLTNPEEFDYLESEAQAETNFDLMESRVGFFGHTHVPMLFEGGPEEAYYLDADEVATRQDRKYLVNPGSVGQPRDGRPAAAFAIYDDEAETVSLRRVEYDVETTQDKILNAGLPEFLAERLGHGM